MRRRLITDTFIATRSASNCRLCLNDVRSDAALPHVGVLRLTVELLVVMATRWFCIQSIS